MDKLAECKLCRLIPIIAYHAVLRNVLVSWSLPTVRNRCTDTLAIKIWIDFRPVCSCGGTDTAQFDSMWMLSIIEAQHLCAAGRFFAC
jgi:hypothetical protein